MAVMFAETIRGSACDCCQVENESSDERYGCQERQGVFTKREQEILAEIRELRHRAQKLKHLIKNAEEAEKDRVKTAEWVAELENLRRKRVLLEKKRTAAAEERMRLLGHL